MSPKNNEIGDPLEQVAATRKIGGPRPAPGSPEVQKSRSLDIQVARPSEVQKSSNLTTQNSGPPAVQKSSNVETQDIEGLEVQKSSNSKGRNDRVQRTVYLPPALAKWLKVQAAQEEREMSEIVADALEAYRHTH